MIKFNLKKAQHHAKLCTRTGLKVKLLGVNYYEQRCLVCSVSVGGGGIIINTYFPNGKYFADSDSCLDLFMAEKGDI